MSNKLTQKEFEQRVFNLVGDKYSVIGEYQGKEFPILMHCNIHNCDFETRARYFMYENHYHVNGGCPKCYENFRHQKSVKITCDYCHKEYYTTPSKLNKSKLSILVQSLKAIFSIAVIIGGNNTEARLLQPSNN